MEEGTKSVLSSYGIMDTALDLETGHLTSDAGSSTFSAGDLTLSPNLTEPQFPHLANGDHNGLGGCFRELGKLMPQRKILTYIRRSINAT